MCNRIGQKVSTTMIPAGMVDRLVGRKLGAGGVRCNRFQGAVIS
jgi:hypothetical protein